MRSVEQTVTNVIRSYVDSAGVAIEADLSDRLSLFIASLFTVYVVHALGEDFIVAEPTADELDLGSIGKQLAQLSSYAGLPTSLYAKKMDAGTRRALIESGVAFLCSNGDLYLPFLALHLRATHTTRSLPNRRFRASDQSVFLYGLYAQDRFTQADVTDATSLSSGSVSRALSNLYAAKMIDYEITGKTGRRKEYFRVNDQVYYQTGHSLFGQATRKTIPTNELPDTGRIYLSGLSALAKMSNLAEPRIETWAVRPEDAGEVPVTEPEPDRGYRFTVQVLGYDPAPFTQAGVMVDPFTMLMTIPTGDLQDERVQLSLHEALKGFTWYVD